MDDSVPKHLEDNLEKWLRKNKIDITPKMWMRKCLLKLGWIEKEKITRERYRRH